MAPQTINPSQGSTYSNPILDGALQNVSGDGQVFVNQLYAWMISEARKADRQNGTSAVHSSGNGASGAINFTFNATMHLTAEPGDTFLQLAVDTTQGQICYNQLAIPLVPAATNGYSSTRRS